jgi:cell division protein FtsW
LQGLGPGKSVQKNFLPQSSSDFIYAIIVEEYGLIGGLIVLGLYLLVIFPIYSRSTQGQYGFWQISSRGIGFSNDISSIN